MKTAPSSLLMLLALTCGPVWAEESLYIGVCLPITGNFAAGGQSLWEGIKVANKMEPHVLGRFVRLKLADSKSTPSGAAIAVRTLTEAPQVSAMMSEAASSGAIAASFHAERRQIPTVTPSATASSRINRYVFRMRPNHTEEATVAADLAIRRLKARTAGVVYDMSQEDSFWLAVSFKEKFKKAGGTVVVETRFKTGDRDFTGQINSIKTARPDVIYAPVYYMECALMARQARIMGVDAPLMAGDAVHLPELVKLGGRSIETLLFTTYFHQNLLNTEMGGKFRKAFYLETGKEPLAGESMGAEAYFLILDAIRRAGSSDSKRIREALAAVSEENVIKSAVMTQKNADGHRPLFVNEVRDGGFVSVSQPAFVPGAEEVHLSGHLAP